MNETDEPVILEPGTVPNTEQINMTATYQLSPKDGIQATSSNRSNNLAFSVDEHLAKLKSDVEDKNGHSKLLSDSKVDSPLIIVPKLDLSFEEDDEKVL